MNVSSVANGQYAAQQSCAGNQTSNFDDVLQEKLQEESQEPSSEPNNEQVGTGMPILDIRTGKPLLDSSGQPVVLSEEFVAFVMAQSDKMIKMKAIALMDTASVPHCIEVTIGEYLSKALVGKTGGEGDCTMGLLGGMLFSADPNLETRIADREAGKNIAKYVAENYFDDPEEAQAFIKMINKIAELSEARDKGYVISSKSFIDTDDKRKQWLKLSDEEKFSYISSLILNIEPAEPKLPFGDPMTENNVSYAKFLEKGLTQKAIDKAKLTTDFSSNEKWNILMSYLNETTLDERIYQASLQASLGSRINDLKKNAILEAIADPKLKAEADAFYWCFQQ